MSATQPHLEIEVKFLAPDLAALRQQLLAAGAVLVKPRTFERNIRFDTPGDDMMQRFQLLRLRQDTAVTLTYKEPTALQQHSEAKVRRELEVTVSDFDTTAAIIRHLGFEPRQVYEKYRETFAGDGVEIVLDELPFGDFVEIEGSEPAIKQAAARFGLEWSRRILTNYLTLMARLKARHHLPFDDLTFANFAPLSLSIDDVLP